jgi:hypothetical protein
MSEERKPREYWVEISSIGLSRVVKYRKNYKSEYTLIHVREVLPDEPDWRAMCEELAKAIRRIPIHDDNIEAEHIRTEALEKYRAMKEKIE